MPDNITDAINATPDVRAIAEKWRNERSLMEAVRTQLLLLTEHPEIAAELGTVAFKAYGEEMGRESRWENLDPQRRAAWMFAAAAAVGTYSNLTGHSLVSRAEKERGHSVGMVSLSGSGIGSFLDFLSGLTETNPETTEDSKTDDNSEQNGVKV